MDPHDDNPLSRRQIVGGTASGIAAVVTGPAIAQGAASVASGGRGNP